MALELPGSRPQKRQGIAPPQFAVAVEEAEVLSVSDDGYRVTVRTRSGRKLDTQILMSLLSLGRDTDAFQGAGATVVPEEGSIAAVITTSYGEHYTFGFAQPYSSTQEYQGNREPRRQGDMTLRSRNGAFVDVLASGFSRQGASDIAQTAYNPEDDSVRHVANKYSISTGMGNLLWEVDDQTGKGAFRVLSRAGTDEGAPEARMVLGDSPSGNLVELSTSSGKNSSFAIERAGNVRVDSDKDATILASSGKIRQQANKIYLNSGAAKARKTFNGNFFELSSAPVQPGEPASLFKFPTYKPPPTALPPQAPKKVLNPTQFTVDTNTLPRVVEPEEGSASSSEVLPVLT